MYIPEIENKIEHLVKLYETRDPFKLAKALDIEVIFEDLGEIYGYCTRFRRIQSIHVNSILDENKQRFTCAHELGHGILHPNENTPLLSKASAVSELKIEKEANYFATNLLVDPNMDGIEYLTKYQKLECFGISDDFVRFL